MYYPLLRGKQFELKALREFSKETEDKSRIIPIIEPVRSDFKLLNVAIEEIMANQMKFALILNPQNGDFKHATIKFNFLNDNQKLISNLSNWIPAFYYNRDLINFINSIENIKIKNGLIILDNIDEDDLDLWNLLKTGCFTHIVVKTNSSVPRRLFKKLSETGCNLIRLDDSFKQRNRNADYLNSIDEFFSESPFYFNFDHFKGFSDYTVLSSEFSEGGSLPYVLAIHLTYKKDEDRIFVHHFLSDSNITNLNIREKFKEAADKVAPFFNAKFKTKAISELIAKANSPQGYPGLGYLKKLSIKNHLELINSLDSF